MKLLIIALCVIVATAQTCPKTDRLTAVELAFKSHEDHIVYGALVACPPYGHELSENVVFRIVQSDDNPHIELNPEDGTFMFRPTEHYSGIESFLYTVEDELERSKPAKVTISMRSRPDPPLLEVGSVFGYNDETLDIKINAALHDTDGSESLMVCMCNCNAEVKCDEQAGGCYCHLTLPKGWEFWTGETRVPKTELHSLTPDILTNLKLKPGNNAEPNTCFDIHAVSYETQGPLVQRAITTKQLHISILPRNDPPLILFDENPDHFTIDTSEGRPIQFTTLKVVDGDNVGAYHVQIAIDQGGSLWVKQEHSNVVFMPKDRKVKNTSHHDYNSHEVGRDESFYDHYHPVDDVDTNNGRTLLEFTGSLWAINEVLSSLVYVPWCAKWPLPPSWHFPEDSWMEPADWDQVMTNDVKYPLIWPEWYPRFWYPFPSKTWYWWPRVWAPYWLDDVCSDWTTNMRMKVTEVTPPSCSKIDKPQQTDEWSAAINVNTRTAPKSLITRNHFTYFDEDDKVVNIQGLYIRSLQKDNLQLRFNTKIIDDVDAWVENSDSHMPTFGCNEIGECNRVLQQLQVHFPSTQDICKLTVEIEMYKGTSNRLADLMTVWVYKTKPECINSERVKPEFRLVTEPVQTRQGQPTDLQISHSLTSLEGIHGQLHVKIRSEFGLLSVPSIPRGLRVYMDHMALHEPIPTKLYMAGPVALVLEALETARFTPLKDFWGSTNVEIEYGITTTGSTRTYGYILPKRTVVQDITIKSGFMPSLPLLMVPRSVCVEESQTMPLNMIKIEERFQESQIVTLHVYSRMGTIKLSDVHEHTDADITTLEKDEKNIAIRGVIPDVQDYINTIVLYQSPSCYPGGLSPVDEITIQLMSDNGEFDQFTSHAEISCVERDEDFEGISEPMIAFKMNKEDSCLEEDTQWNDWSDCSADFCGVGVQYRERKCGDPDWQERECVKCGCEPVAVTVHNPSASLLGCESVNPITQCPDSCEPMILKYEDREFMCSELDMLWLQTKPIAVHQKCICKSCTSHRNYKPWN